MEIQSIPCLTTDARQDNLGDGTRVAMGNVNEFSSSREMQPSQLRSSAPQQQVSSLSPHSGDPKSAQVHEKRKFCEISANASTILSPPSTIAGDGAHRSYPEGNPSLKRPRFDAGENHYRAEILRQAEELRRQGTIPQTLFFPSLPVELKKDNALREAIGCSLRELKTHQAKNKKMAWATFASENECLDKLLALKISFPALKVSLHRPRQNQDTSSRQQSGNAQAFDRRVQGIIDRGGIGNTLMFRNLPIEVDCEELENALRNIPEMANISSSSLRVRMALSKGRGGRNFWLVYAGVEACRAAFVHLMNKKVSFRCGKSAKLHPIVHDDTTDVDETKRRERARALGTQRSKTKGKVEEISTDIFAHLEAHLRATQTKFFFLSSQSSGR
eukprot:GFKZ01011524.1.p1 GENE.GFKZ01011524.1~~GFKZ01011524.1.p1  ORF type:complete len:388 (-),score=63.34 GFKZ01011524.1:226-1389(-)